MRIRQKKFVMSGDARPHRNLRDTLQPMTPFSRNTCLAVLCSGLWGSALLAAETPDYQSKLFTTTKLIYADTFDGPMNLDFWEARQSTTWVVKNGVLTGGPSSPEFRDQKKVSDDPTNAGEKPVLWLKQVPETFVCTMRIRYDGKDYLKGFPLIDLGHHIHTFSFGKNETTLKIRKDVEVFSLPAPLFSLNEWHDVAIELKKGTILLTIDGHQHRFDSPAIDGTGHHQIDFKGIDFGGCQIDDIKLWEGL